ncbi:MAG: hypothetical protein Q7K34_04625 [archaeon]|nr:hypothetical protein [archaeon]
MKIEGRTFVIVFFALFLSSYIYACTPPLSAYTVQCTVKELQFTGNISCLNDACDYNVTLDTENGANRESLYYPSGSSYIHRSPSSITFYFGDPVETPRAVSYLCAEDTSDLKGVFSKYLPSYQYNYYRNFTVAPYTSEKESLLQPPKGITGCTYTSYENIGNWIVGQEKTQSYCESFGGGGGECSTVSHSLVKLFFYSIQNPSWEVLSSVFPYLAIPILFFVFLSILMAHLYKRKKVKEFFYPTTSLGVSTLFILFASNLVLRGNLEQAILLTMIYYVLFCIARQFFFKQQRKTQ